MKVQWEESDVRAGRHVWRDMECMIGADPNDYRAPAVIIVLETGRVMKIGSKAEIAEYLTEYGYRPGAEK
ncbi:hypothetical protein EVB78_160 [Rhizobium phage RHph_N1_15]|nr:hypothetical protein EVB77_160 [Rhizobium phage RHph_N1_10]QIG69362.1 hypothetical protein EVB78_160 [Rhizobium phage RHph_N1_15]QIG75222.1 hypothetical protein EVC15_160 [Rhizobium phage RHph_N2_6]